MRHYGSRGLTPVAVAVLVIFSGIPLAGCTDNSTAAPASTAQATVVPTTSSEGPPAPAPSTAEARSDPVPAPSGGSVQQVVPPAAAGPVTKVELNKTADLPDNVSITVSKVESIETKATTPGEIAGPAVALYVTISNGSVQKITVDSAIVTLTGTGGVLGQPTTSDPFLPFSGELAAGASAEGVYVFLIPTNARTGLTLSVEYAAGQASAQFVGDVS